MKNKILILNNIQLMPEEKFRILNFKPQSEIEIALVRYYIYIFGNKSILLSLKYH